MSAGVTTSPAAPALPIWRDPAAWAKTADIFAVLIALSLPWSTSLVGIFGGAGWWRWCRFSTPRPFLESLKRPICALPIALFALAVVGTLWSDAPWGARLYAIGPTAKLLMLPVLFYHFERSARGMQVFIAFLVSCTLLMAMSWIVAFDPGLALKSGAEYGVPVKNYIDQSQEFALCAVALAYPIITLLRAKRILLAVLLIAVALSFVVNMAFVVVSRTALVTMPIMLAVFALLHLKWRSIVIILCVTTVFAGLAWATSPQLRWTTATFLRDYEIYKERNDPTSIGLRLEFWQKSLRFFAEAPIIGHGTGSTRGLFEQAAAGQARRRRRGHRQSAQPDPECRGAVGRDRNCRAIRDVAAASAAVPRRRLGSLDRTAGRGAKYFQLAVQFAHVRFPRRVDVRLGRRSCRRNDAEGAIRRDREQTG